MRWQFWQGWSIGTRMACIAMLPVVLLFASFMGYSWYSHRIQVAEELAERGRILARALAETSEYNVISGNLSDLKAPKGVEFVALAHGDDKAVANVHAPRVEIGRAHV